MNPKHLAIRIDQCQTLAKASNCLEGGRAALLLDPLRNVLVMDGYEGAARGGWLHCGGDEVCTRRDKGLERDDHLEVGCHHAEINVICNAAANGMPTRGAWLIVTGMPCLLCAKLIHHCGITKVLAIADSMGNEVASYFGNHGIAVEFVKAPIPPTASAPVTD